MSRATIEERVEALEKQLNELMQDGPDSSQKPGWISKIKGSFADDPEFDEILRLGREFREEDRPPSNGTE